MIVDDRLWELIHEYKLVECQAKAHMENGNIDSYIDCLDMMTKIKDDIEIYHRKLERRFVLFVNLN